MIFLQAFRKDYDSDFIKILDYYYQVLHNTFSSKLTLTKNTDSFNNYKKLRLSGDIWITIEKISTLFSILGSIATILTLVYLIIIQKQ